jgi:hypothetical protein
MKFKLLTAGIIAFFIGYSSICVAGQSGAEQQKPGEITVAKITLEAIVEAVDYDARKVTLKDTDGKTVKVRNPENLEKVVIGDKVMIMHTQAIGVSVTEKTSQQ